MNKICQYFFLKICLIFIFICFKSINLNALQGNPESYKFKGKGFQKQLDFNQNDMEQYYTINKDIFTIEGIEFIMSHMYSRSYFYPGEDFKNPDEMDIYVRLDSKAQSGNENGFQAGAWIPSSKVTYKIQKQHFDSNSTKDEGDLLMLVDRYGPHYGKNLKLFGKGKYIIHINFYPPKIASIYQSFNRKFNELASVSPIFKYPVQLVYEFLYKD